MIINFFVLIVLNSICLTSQLKTFPSELRAKTYLNSSLVNYNLIHNYFPKSFMFTKLLSDGETVTKVRVNDIVAIQTETNGLCLRQLSDKSRLIQLWLFNDELIDCEVLTDEKSAKQFEKNFFDEIIENDIPNWRSFKHDKINQLINCNQNSNGLCSSNLLNQTDQLSNVKLLINYNFWHKKCHQLHHKLQMKYGIKNKHQRWKRQDLLVFPGTNWCGKGSTSRNFEDLGIHVFADKCCRDHDGCKYTIGPFETKYHLFNYRFHYVSHCACDEKFRACLKMSRNGMANLIGKIFFNVVQTKCFVFKLGKVCTKKSWWGKCLKMKRKKKAFFKNALRY